MKQSIRSTTARRPASFGASSGRRLGLFTITIAVLLIGSPASEGSAQTNDNPLLESQQAAMRLIERAIAAHGGLDRLRAAHTVRLDGRFSNIALGQAKRPGAESANGNPIVLRQVRDLRSDRRIYEVVQSDTATLVMSRIVYDNSDVALYSPVQNTVQKADRAFTERFLRQVPYVPAILTRALDRVGTARALAAVTIDGARYDVATFATESGAQQALLFDARTGLLDRSWFVEDNATIGDNVAEVRYSDYRNVDGVMIPHHAEARVGGYLTGAVDFIRVEFDVEFDDSKLDIPAEANEGPAIGTPAVPANELTVEKLGDGVYLVPNASPGYNTAFVELPDQVMVLEAVMSPDVTTAVMEKIRETIPSKPIGTVAITHYHFDHSGGLYPYIAAGVQVVTTEGNLEYVRSIGRAPRTISGAGEPADAILETVVDKATFGSGAHRVELYQVGPYPHVDEMLVAYVPAAKLLFTADTYVFTGEVQPAGADALVLADRIRALGLDVETIVPVHGEPTPATNFWAAVELARAGSSSSTRF